MTAHNQHQEFPKMIYRLCEDSETVDVVLIEGRKVKYKIVQSAAEQKNSRGWCESPADAVKKKRFRFWAQTKLKPWWEKWEWMLKLTATILVLLAAGLKVWESLPTQPKPSAAPPPAISKSK